MKRRRILNVEAFEDRINPGPIPVLNSLPSAPADIFLDFDGDTGQNVTPYDTDGNPSDYSASEQADIIRCHAQISLYFAMFNVNVTTVYTAARPKAWLCIGNNISGGYSYVNVFPNSTPQSFNQSSDARNRLSGLAHEIGHNFGASHQSAFDALGNETADYISAIEPLRGFLMGVDYSGTVKKWSIGHTTNASSLQDDLAVIATDLDNYGGDGYRPDDFGNTIATATPLIVSGAMQTHTGIIERYTDLDVFSFTSPGGPTAITVAPEVPSGLDAILEVRDGSNSLIAVADTVANGQTLTVNLPAGTFYVVVGSKGNYADLGQYQVFVTEGAPDNFQTQNIGLSWYTGRTEYSAATSTWTVIGGGAGITGTADQFHFAWRHLSGDGTITARVTNVEPTNNNAKAGVMVRESLADNSRHAGAFVPRALTPQMVYRTTTGGGTSTVGGSSTSFTPRWVRLIKTGNSIQTQHSLNGTSWTTISTQTVNVGSTFYVGLAVSSHEDEETNTTDDLNDATFTNVTITGFTDPMAVTNAALATPANFAVTLGTGNAVNLAWDTVSGATGYTIERAQDGNTFTTLGTTTSTSYIDANPLGSQRYWYRVRATNAGGRGDATSPLMITNRPSAVRMLEFCSYSQTQVVLDWLDTDGETGFKIERSSDGGSTWTQIGTVAKNIPSYTASGLTAGTAYSFRVTPTSSLGDGPGVVIGGSTRIPAVTTLTLGSITSTSIQLNWTDIAGETGYRIERSTNGSSFSTIATVGANVTTFTNTALAPETEYYYRVVGTLPGSESISGGNIVMAGTPPTTPIPSPWLSTDIGMPVSQRGMSAQSGGTFKVISGGSDIGGTSDAFRFTYQPIVGNGAITARVATLEATGTTSGAGAEIGVMIRESLAANSRHAHVAVTQNSGVHMQHRSSTGGGTTTTGSTTGLTVPYWVRMTRVGNTLSGFRSADGNTWTLVASTTISGLATTVYVGLSASANSITLLNTSTYTNVSVFTNGVQSATVDDGSIQRSMVRSLTVTFNGTVSLGAGAFTVVRTGGGNPAFTIDTSASTSTQTIARLIFNGSVADGDYTLTVVGSQVTDTSGLNLGPMSSNFTLFFHRLFGDSNGSRTVDGADFSSFGGAFGSSIGQNPNVPYFDSNLDGTIDGSDFAEFGARFGVTI